MTIRHQSSSEIAYSRPGGAVIPAIAKCQRFTAFCFLLFSLSAFQRFSVLATKA
jgi:hypothetical protein